MTGFYKNYHGTRMKYFNWATHQPLSNGNCISIGTDGKWNTPESHCESTLKAYLCEKQVGDQEW